MHYKLGQVCVTNWEALFYYKLGQTLLQIGAASLLQDGADVVTNWSSITNWSSRYYKMWQLLQTGAKIIANWGRFYKYGQLLQI